MGGRYLFLPIKIVTFKFGLASLCAITWDKLPIKFIQLCNYAEDEHLLFLIVVIQRGRTEEAEAAFEKLLGGSHAQLALAELSKSDRGDDTDTVKISELLYGRHFKGTSDTFLVYFFEDL